MTALHCLFGITVLLIRFIIILIDFEISAIKFLRSVLLQSNHNHSSVSSESIIASILSIAKSSWSRLVSDRLLSSLLPSVPIVSSFSSLISMYHFLRETSHRSLNIMRIIKLLNNKQLLLLDSPLD